MTDDACPITPGVYVLRGLLSPRKRVKEITAQPHFRAGNWEVEVCYDDGMKAVVYAWSRRRGNGNSQWYFSER